MRDSTTDHFISRSIRTTEHEITQILVPGRVAIDQMCVVCVSVSVCLCVCVAIDQRGEDLIDRSGF